MSKWSLFNHQILAVAVVLALLTTGVAEGQFQLFDDFEDETLGLIGGQDGWSSGGGDNQVVVDPAAAGNQVLYVPSASSILYKPLAHASLGVPDGTVRMMFLRLRVANKQTFSFGLSSMSRPSEYSDFSPEIGMANSAPNLDLRVWDDDGGNYEVLTQLEADKWYNMWVRVDTLLDQYEIWLNDVPGASAAAGDKLAAADGDETFEFRVGGARDLVTFYLKTSGGSSSHGPVYFDDIHLEQADATNLGNPTNAILGDLNCDGAFNGADIDPFFLALGDPAAYGIAFPDCDIMLGDMNGDGRVDGGDIDVFFECLAAGCP